MSAKTRILLVCGYITDAKCENTLRNTLLDTLTSCTSKINSDTVKFFLNELANYSLERKENSEFGVLFNVEKNDVKFSVQFMPSVEQFRVLLNDTLQSFMVGDPSSVLEEEANVHILYNGQVCMPGGDWLLADSSLNGEQLYGWFDGQTTKKWLPVFDRLVEYRASNPANVHVYTSFAGTGTEWPVSKINPGDSLGILSAIINKCRIRLNFHVHASLKANGKLHKSTAAANEHCEKLALRVLQLQERFPWGEGEEAKKAAKTPPNALSTSNDSLSRNLKVTRPSLFVFPVGDSCANSGAALFTVDGFSAIIGSCYANKLTRPGMWQLVTSVSKIDAIILPDWSAKSIMFQQYLHDVMPICDTEFGAIIIPPGKPEEDGSLSLVSSHCHDHDYLRWAPNSSTDAVLPKCQLYHKIGAGELYIQPLVHKAGQLVVWRHKPDIVRILISNDHLLPAGTSPATALIRLYKNLMTVGQTVTCADGLGQEVPKSTLSNGSSRPKTADATPLKRPTPTSARLATSKPALPVAAAAAAAAASGKTATNGKPSKPITKPAVTPAPTKKLVEPAKKPAVKKMVVAAIPPNLPSNLPPRRDNNEKTIMEEIAAIPEESVNAFIPQPPSPPAITPDVPELDSLESSPSTQHYGAVTCDLAPDSDQKHSISTIGLSSDLLPDHPIVDHHRDSLDEPETNSLVGFSLNDEEEEAEEEEEEQKKEKEEKKQKKEEEEKQKEEEQEKKEEEQEKKEEEKQKQKEEEESTPLSDCSLLEASIEQLPSDLLLSEMLDVSTTNTIQDLHCTESPNSEASVDSVVHQPGKTTVTETEKVMNNGDDINLIGFTGMGEMPVLGRNGHHQNGGETNHFPGQEAVDAFLQQSQPAAVPDMMSDGYQQQPYPEKCHVDTMPQVTDHDVNDPAALKGLTPPITDSTALGFDAVHQWGEPENLPPPSRGPTKPSSASTAATGRRVPVAKSTSLTNQGPTALPSGPVVYLDVCWVPGYIARVPDALAVEFFGRVRARLYVLSGESLHPSTAEALCKARQTWKANEVNALTSLSGDLKQITILATDEPTDWIRWLRTPGDGSSGDNDTGEQRLKKAGFNVADAANLCDIKINISASQVVSCSGSKIDF